MAKLVALVYAVAHRTLQRNARGPSGQARVLFFRCTWDTPMRQYEDFKYGHKCFRTIGGVRHLVAVRPTIRPYPAETEHAFEERMARMEEILSADARVTSIEARFKYDNERIVECELDVALVPEPQPVLDLGTTTSRRAEPRGTRGQRRREPVPV